MKTIKLLLVAIFVSGPVWAETNAQVPHAPAASNRAGVTETPIGEAMERHLDPDDVSKLWLQDDSALRENKGDRIERREVLEKQVNTVKLRNVVPPIHFGSGDAEIPPDYVEKLRAVLEKMKSYNNVRLHFVGHSDSVRLMGAAKAKYGDNTGLSRERAGVAAEFFKEALELPPEAISYEGLGERQPIASNTTASGKAQNRRVEVEVWYDEIEEKLVEKDVLVSEQINRVKVCRVETVCKIKYKEGRAKRARIKNLIQPLRFDDEFGAIPPEYVVKARQALGDLKTKQNVVMKFIGYTDGTPLQGRDARIYGSQKALSKARSRRVALAMQDALGMPHIGIDSDGNGDKMPVASNDTESGRALNRRVEVEFWYDDAFQDLPDEPQLCPEAVGAETVTKVYDPPSGAIAPIHFDNGKPVVAAEYVARLGQLMSEVGDKTNVRLRFVGYTENKRLDRRMAMVYGDDVGLSTARARRAMEVVTAALSLKENQAEHEGRGYVQADDVVTTGFVESDVSKVDVQVVYDELAALDDDSKEITRITREVSTSHPFALNYMRITVDGQPLHDPGKSSEDVQRCTDVALEKAHIQFKFDNLDLKPRLNVSAWPVSVRYQDDPDTEFPENLVHFRTYNNYPSFIKRAEVRLFNPDQSTRDVPVAVVEIGSDGTAEWQANFDTYAAPGRELKYVLRVFDAKGRFDETAAQTLWVVDQLPAERAEDDLKRELLVGYGETRIAAQNIPLKGGTIKAYGKGIPAGHSVWLAGDPVRVGKDGAFVAEKILDHGVHTVEVAVLDDAGNGELFLRDLELKKNDWFYVGIADVTLSASDTNGPAKLVTNGNARYDNDLSVEGRLAGYARGTFGDNWQLTTSADTREGPVEDLFTNFLDKSPDALFRRVDPDYHYPTYGDDSTVEEGAPTLGKFYLKVQKDRDYGLWGNFKIGYVDNTLAHVDRGLYGANVHVESADKTGFGEERWMVDGFAAQPGTAAGRDEFRGTGGSLYYLRHQDILTGSDRLRIEVRDKDSNMVRAVKNLSAGLDYTIDYLQGRVLLSEPLSATAEDNLLVDSGAGAGHVVYLVARYEFTPGFDDTDNLSNGGRVHYWFNDYVRLGLVANENKDAGDTSKLNGSDLLVRKNAQTWFKAETAKSEGVGVTTLQSGDGGFSFMGQQQVDVLGVEGGAYRLDASAGFADLYPGAQGSATVYKQFAEAGYSAPGFAVGKDTDQYGGTLVMPINEKIGLRAKADRKVEEEGLETSTGEVDVDYALDEHWTVSAGARSEYRNDRSVIVPLTQIEGERTDVVARGTYDSKERWMAYGYAQSTARTTGNQERNGRIGTGGAYRFTDRLKGTGEASAGDLGGAGKLGVEYLYSDRTNVYTNYAMENERTDNGIRARKGNLVSGFRSHYSDTTSVFMEERYAHGDVPTGLTHATGVDLAPNDRWSFGVTADFGTLRDNRTGAKTERTAVGARVGYALDSVKVANALEYRVDKNQNLDLSQSTRTTWLTKNSVKYQISPDWRFIGKFDHSKSESTLGEFYDGSYTELVAGYGYRPVKNDRLNTLMKYTYFYNLPSAGQTTVANTAAAFVQKSNIASVDVLYDLTARWTIGGKYAYRHGQVSVDRVNPQFFDSHAHLYVARADWRFTRRWDALIEARMLDIPTAQDRRSGALVAVYRHVNENVKAGLGYNFTDFSDDLTDLDYDNQGVFLNIVGSI